MLVTYLIILLCSFLLLLFFKTKRSLHMLQQNLYNENNRYLKWVYRNSNQFLRLDIILIIISILGVFGLFKDNIAFLSFIVMTIIALIESIHWYRKINNDQNKKPLVVTARIKRMIFTITILYLLPAVYIGLNLNSISSVFIGLLIISLMIYLNSIVTFIGCIINYPIERIVYHYYKYKAQSKLKEMKNLKIIGITGSYGKTSSKNILSDILNVKYNALPTPRNLNTYNGLIMTVNNYMDKFTDIFIAEMGAYVKGEIAGLCRLVKPKYGILTKIGTAHMESFGSQENIQKGKFELIESLPSDGFGVLNGDDPLQVNYKLKNNVKIIWVGIENKDVDVLATNIKCSSKGTTFDVKFKGDSKKYSFETKLLGQHNVYNILEAIACGREFGIDIDDLIHAVKGVKTIEHRLELKKIANFYMIDDAYNSNPDGAKRAVEVLGMMDGIKVVVTPGMIELGDKEKEYNQVFGEQIGKVADYVILVGEKRTKPIKEGLIKSGFNEDNIIIMNDVRSAYPFIETLTGKKDVYALFENDLPDTYNE